MRDTRVSEHFSCIFCTFRVRCCWRVKRNYPKDFFSVPEGTGRVETYVLHANRSIINVVYDRCFTSSDFVHSVLSSVAFFTTVLVFFGRFLFAVNVVL